MGIKAEFNCDMALRDISEFKNGNRKLEECIPEKLEAGKVYDFLKKDQRLYYISDDPQWDFGEIPLCVTQGEGKLSRPLASVKILEATHFLLNGEIHTKGKYKVIEVFDPKDPKIHFENLKRIK
ncbi:MAG: hypothetical protein ISS36_02165 [Candidatus Aenigmarchaeota archaeon]|nr:hypothetical protein [Candidatus Aenigmarchaeota archaeon]